MSRFVRLAISAAAVPLLGMAAVPATAFAQSATPIEVALRSSGSDLESFYSARNYRPIWTRGGFVLADAHRLIEILERADLDGMQDGAARAAELQRAIEQAESGEPDDLARVELMLSNAWVDYVQTLRRPVDVGMNYVDPSLAPSRISDEAILKAAASASSLARHMEEVSELNPVYNQLRQGLLAMRESGRRDRLAEQRVKLNMDRARLLPADRTGKYILVDAASQRLFMYEDGEVRDSMRVVVGKPEQGTETPMLAGLIRFSVLNPYWNVPPDLVRKNIAANVLDQGTGYLRAKRYEVLSDWTDDARVLDPEEVDWEAVASGRQEVRVRQLPGQDNFMGDVKFMFPNKFGVYLHDTPDKSLFSQTERTLSSGCVRLEDANRLAQWLYGRAPRARSSAPEQEVALPQPVPVYINYFTARWDGQQLALLNDFYGRDRVSGQSLAAGRGGASD